MSRRIELGHGHSIELRASHDDAARIVGAIVRHPSPDGECERIGSYIGLDAERNTPPATWTVESWEPLTLAPSLHCTHCGDHGFIRGGKWVPA